MKKEKYLGNIKTISTTLNNFNFSDVSFNNISIFVGQNGTGKTLILILVWIAGCMANMFLASGKSIAEYKALLQYLLDHSFDDQHFNGDFLGDFGDMQVSYTLVDGKVTNFDIIVVNTNDTLLPAGMLVFMSKQTRLFSEIIMYLKTRKMLGINGGITMGDPNFEKMLELYKIYDVMFIERMLMNLQNPNFKINPVALKSFEETLGKKIVSVSFDEITPNILIHEEKKDGKVHTYPASTMSAGEQAWVNMFIQN